MGDVDVGKTFSVVVFGVVTVVFIVVGVVLMVVVVDMELEVVSKSTVTAVESRSRSLCLIVYKTNPNTPRPRRVPRARRREQGLNDHLLCFRVSTCRPSRGGLTG